MAHSENAGGTQSQGAGGAAVVYYCKPPATRALGPSGVFTNSTGIGQKGRVGSEEDEVNGYAPSMLEVS